MKGAPRKRELESELQRLRDALGGSSESSSSAEAEAATAVVVDDLFHRFQEVDRRDKGAIAASDDFDLLVDHFLTSKGRFDYVAFCKALKRCGQQQTAIATKKSRNQRSPRKQTAPTSPQRRRNRLPDQQPRIRVDRRLEAQRLATQSIRKKLLRGVYGAKSDGFLGVQDTLFNLDRDGEGYLDERVFTEQFLPRLKSPLTQTESEFLLMNIRMRGGEIDDGQQEHGKKNKDKSKQYRIDYEQMGVICNLDSDVSLSSDSGDHDSDADDYASGHHGSPQKAANSNSAQSNLGADFLAAEKRVQAFLRQQQQAPRDSNGLEIHDTPRTLFTGAERFLEHAEEIDRTKSGFLREQDFCRILKKCGVDISQAVLCSILSRFPRTSDGLINYTSFLQRYDQNPQHSRERRKLKRFLLGVLPSLRSSRTEWSGFLKDRFEKYDAKLHKVKRSEIRERGLNESTLFIDMSLEFLHVLRGKTGPLKLSAEQAVEVLTLFLAVSPSSSPTKINYSEFLKFVQELQPQSPESPIKSAANTGTPSFTTKTTVGDVNVSSPSKSPSKVSPGYPLASEAATVGDYLMYHATTQERKNFEQLMDLLHKFHSSLRPMTLSPPGTPVTPPRSPPKKPTEAAPQAIVPIENGVQIALGEKLCVQIQFSTE